ncbi:MAG: helix-turn-helix transcriptional regulator [Clostridia bacterium]|nr:helix-turn-helix transcriptional regulator [Clostridia bacterium]
MQENIFKTEAGGISLTAFIFADGFHHYRREERPDAIAEAISLHRHSTYELFLSPQTMVLVTEGERQSYQNSLVIIPPHIDHFALCEEGCYALNFSFETDTPLAQLIDRGITVLPMREQESFYICQLAEALKGTLPAEQAEHLVALLFSCLFHRLSPQKEEEKTGKYSNYINTLDTYISGHYSSRITLEQLAQKLFLCPRQVSRIIKKAYGCTLPELVHRKRLSAACKLLRHTDLPVSEIAAGVGYEYETYFFTRFKAEFGCTPIEYRNS